LAEHLPLSAHSLLIETVTSQGVGTGWTSERLEGRVTGNGLRANQIVTFVPRHLNGDALCDSRSPLS